MSSAMQTAFQVQSALTSIGSPPVEDSSSTRTSSSATVKGEDTDDLVTKVKNSWLLSAALVAIASAACSMFMTASIVVDFACLTVFVLAPVAIVQKRRLAKLGGMRGQQNDLRMTVNSMSAENNVLKKSVSDMQNAVHDLQNVEKDLQAVVQKTGGQVDRLVAIIQENAKLQAKIKRNLEAQVLQSVLSSTMKSDTDLNFTFDSPSELRRLKMNLSNIPGITFDKDNFDKKVGNKNSLTLVDIMEMFRNLKDDIPEEENIFHITPEQLVVKRGFFG